MGGGAAAPNPPRYFLGFFTGIEMPFYLKPVFVFRARQPSSYFLGFFTHNLLVMLGMLVGLAGDVENDAGDVDGLVYNSQF